jgi:uncharacterized protein (DUF934 family)
MPTLFDLHQGAVRELDLGETLHIGSDVDLAAEPPQLEGIATVGLEMGTFKDGRAFTQARLLRQRLGFEGQIVVRGHVLPDQAQALLRVGASLVELSQPERAEDFAKALRTYRYAYQRPATEAPVFELRGGRP